MVFIEIMVGMMIILIIGMIFAVPCLFIYAAIDFYREFQEYKASILMIGMAVLWVLMVLGFLELWELI